MLNKIY